MTLKIVQNLLSVPLSSVVDPNPRCLDPVPDSHVHSDRDLGPAPDPNRI